MDPLQLRATPLLLHGRITASSRGVKAYLSSSLHFFSYTFRRKHCESIAVFCNSEGSKVADRLARDFEFSNVSETPAVLSVLSPPPAAAADRYISLPVDFYKVLGADTHFLSDGIRRAFEARCSTPPLDGFSQETLLARRQILQVACDTLSDPESRGEYNQMLAEDQDAAIMSQIPWDKVPGVLCLLQESGDAEVVIQVGKRLLRERLSKPFKRDIVLAMALAYVDRSRDAMALFPPDIINGCDALERALKLLKEEGATNLAPSLLVQIDETLEEITPHYILELLALPLDEKHKRSREEGLLGIRNIMWAVGGGGADAVGGGFTRVAFIKEVFSCLTSAEQVDLYLDRPANVAVEGFEVYTAALAFVAQAFVRKNPSLVKNADTLFSELEEVKDADFASKAELETGFALGRGLCSLLVGDVDSCRAWLGLDDETFPSRSESVVDFVKEHSSGEEEDTLLLGLCTLLDHWLTQVVFPKFRDTRQLESRIGDYYDNPNVLEHLRRLEDGGVSPLAAAAAIVRVGARATAALWNVLPVGTGEEERSENLTKDDAFDDAMGESGWLNPRETEFAKLLGVGVAAGLLGWLGFRLLSMRSLPMVRGNGADVETSADVAALDHSISNKLPMEGERMDAKLAEAMVRQWQNVKSQALGSSHSAEKLSEVLDGEMLKVWKDRASEIKDKNYFWEYDLHDLTIDSITISLDRSRAVVDATLDESSRINNLTQPGLSESSRSTYSVRYIMAYSAPSGWRIIGGAVLKP